MSDDSLSEEEERTVEQLNDEADIAADYLEGLLDIMDYEGDIEMGIRNGRPVVQIVADDDTDIKNLIGRDGEVVNALQQLTRLAVQQKTGERSRLILDVDGYLTRKRKHIRDMVLDIVDEVRETGEPVSLDPMNSFERKIVHDIVRDEGLRSRSHGAEPERYVTIYPKSSASPEDEDDFDDSDDVPAQPSRKNSRRNSRRNNDAAEADLADVDVSDVDVSDVDESDSAAEDYEDDSSDIDDADVSEYDEDDEDSDSEEN